ncbi:MAG: hypothetical protein HFE28_01515 [Clostridia bacterium]|jgi:Sec-independent protein translocase protein TatA|nr:hypothetical protein [Clostridia bacterium]
MKKILKLIFAVCMAACFLLFPMFMGNAPASAEEVAEPPVTDETTDETETVEDGLKALVDGFLAQLKAKYGDDYETYYNAIITQWGSVEEYLLSLVTEDTPDAVANGWTAFVKWLGEYSPVWGSIFAVVAVIIVVLLGKKALNKVTGFVMGTGSKFKTLFSEINKIDAALSAQSKALVKLLGENEKFKEERENLEKTAGDITNDDKI